MTRIPQTVYMQCLGERRSAYWERDSTGDCLMRWEGAEEASCLQWVGEAGCSEVCLPLRAAVWSQLPWAAQVVEFLQETRLSEFLQPLQPALWTWLLASLSRHATCLKPGWRNMRFRWCAVGQQ